MSRVCSKVSSKSRGFKTQFQCRACRRHFDLQPPQNCISVLAGVITSKQTLDTRQQSMCCAISHLTPLSEKSQIPSPNLQTACLNHTASYSVGTGGSAVEHEIRKSNTLCYTQNCHPVLYAVYHVVCIYIKYLILHLTQLDHTKWFLFTESLPKAIALLKYTRDSRKLNTNTEFLFNTIYKPESKSNIILFTMPDTALQYMAC